MGLPSSSLTFCLSLLSVIAFNESLRAKPAVAVRAGLTAVQNGLTQKKPSRLMVP